MAPQGHNFTEKDNGGLAQWTYRYLFVFLLGIFLSQPIHAERAQAQIAQLIRQNRLDEAERQLWSVLGTQSEAGWALDLLGTIRLRQSRFEEAEAVFHKASAIDSKDLNALRGLGETYRLQGKNNQSIEEYSNVVNVAPADQRANLALARLYLDAGQYERSLLAAHRVLPGSRPAEFLPIMAASYFGLHQSSKVPPLLHQVFRQSLAHPDTAVEFARVLALNGYLDDAAQLLKTANPAKPSVEYLRVLARVLDAQGHRSEAQQALEHALKQNPDSEEVLFDSAHLAADAGEWSKAAGFLERANRVSPDRVDVLTKLTVAQLRLGRVEAAVENAKRVVELRPDDLDEQYLLALAYIENHRWEAAEPIANKLTAARPRDANSQLLLAKVQFDKDDRPAAKQALAQCLAIDPNLAEAHFYSAQIAEREGDFELARFELERLVKRVPDNPAWQDELGALYLKTGDLQKARAPLETTVRLAPDVALGHYHLGLVYTRLGLPDLARTEIEQYQKLRVVEEARRKNKPASDLSPPSDQPQTSTPKVN